MREGQGEAPAQLDEQRARYTAHLAPLARAGKSPGTLTKLQAWTPSTWSSAISSRRTTVASAVRGLRSAMQEEAEYGHGFVLVPVLLALGSICWFALAEAPGIAELAALTCVFGMAALFCSGRFRPYRPLVLAPCLVAGGMLLAAIETVRLGTVVLDGPVTTNVRGIVLSREADDKGRWRYLVEIRETAAPQLRRPPTRATLLARSRHAPFPIGSAIEGKVRLSPPSGPALPGLNDFAFDAYYRGIGAVGFFFGTPRATAGAEIAAESTMSVSMRVAAYLAATREAVGNRIRTTIGGDTGAMAAALVTDEERAISRETVEILRSAGLSHVLAISGLNMVLTAGTFLVGARTLLNLLPGLAEKLAIKKIAAAGALLMVFLYILISGGAVSALRSWIMITIMLFAVFFDRVSISLRNVALAALVIIAWSPSSVAGPGFQMSFAATLALVAGYARWRDHRGKGRQEGRSARSLGPAGSLVAGTVATSFIGGLATAIYAAAHFQRLPAYGLAANIAATPLIGILIMPFGLFAMLLMPFGLEYYPLMMMGQGLEWMLAVARYVAALDADWVTGRVGDFGFVSIASGGVLLCVLRTRLALLGAVLVLMGGTAIALERQAERPSILVSEDGRLVGVVSDEAIATNRTRPPDFIFSQWQRALALGRHMPPVELASSPGGTPGVGVEAAVALATAKPGVFHCRENAWCAGRSRKGWAVLVIDAPELFPAVCGRADLVIAATRRPLPACASGRALILTGETLRLSGAVEIYADRVRPGELPRMRAVTAFRSTERPWQHHRRYDWRSNTFSTVLPAI